jgi:hypothetical protein
LNVIKIKISFQFFSLHKKLINNIQGNQTNIKQYKP